MIWTLKHQNISVADIEINDNRHTIERVLHIHNADHVPCGIPGEKTLALALAEWWDERGIPDSRSGLKEALESLKVLHKNSLKIKAYGLNLSDQYWVCPQGKDIDWHGVNFFENDFFPDVGNALFGGHPKGTKTNFMSPDSSSDGYLVKKWIIAEGRRVLVKAGSAPYYQEPLNEVMASFLMEKLNITHVDYALSFKDDKPLSLCDDFITKDMELVAAQRVLQVAKKERSISNYQHIIQVCHGNGVADIEGCLEKMLTIDYIIANTDRHYNNFGIIRNATTLQWLRFAPVYDSGNSLWYNTLEDKIKPYVPSKPFKEYHDRQIKLVKNFDWFNSAAISHGDEFFEELLKKSNYITPTRRDALCKALKSRIDSICQKTILISQDKAREKQNEEVADHHFICPPSFLVSPPRDAPSEGSSTPTSLEFP
jgi:hypothetical protein